MNHSSPRLQSKNLAQFSHMIRIFRFIDRGAVRIGSTEHILDADGHSEEVHDISNVAFLNLDRQLVVQVQNQSWKGLKP